MAQMMRVGLYRPVHVKTLRSQKLRMLLTQAGNRRRIRRARWKPLTSRSRYEKGFRSGLICPSSARSITAHRPVPACNRYSGNSIPESPNAFGKSLSFIRRSRSRIGSLVSP
jgi:hypothetical protein